jgi:hypothetical protein
MHHFRMFLVSHSNFIPDLSKKSSAHSPKFRTTVLYIKNNSYFTGYVELFTWHMFERLFIYRTYRTPRVVSEWTPLSMVGIRTDNAQGKEISVAFPQNLQANVMTVPLCFTTKYTFRLKKKLRDTDCSESRSDCLSSSERPNVPLDRR